MGRHQDPSLSPWSEYHHSEARPPWLTLASGPSRSRSCYLVVQGSPAVNHVISVAGHRSTRPQVNWDVTQAGHSIPSALTSPLPGAGGQAGPPCGLGAMKRSFWGLQLARASPNPISVGSLSGELCPRGAQVTRVLSPLLVAAQQHIPTPKFIKNEVLAHLPRWITASLSRASCCLRASVSPWDCILPLTCLSSFIMGSPLVLVPVNSPLPHLFSAQSSDLGPAPAGRRFMMGRTEMSRGRLVFP